MGRPAQAYDDKGELVWLVEFDIYGRIREDTFNNKSFIPFRQLGQYEDKELDGLYYNRFRYYDSNTGTYISQDPIGLAGNNPNLYAYTHDSNTWVDPFGLNPLVGLDLGNMRRDQIGEILSGVENISWKGGSPDGQFMQWKYTETPKLPDSVNNKLKNMCK